jgi:hypothetical protein
MSIFAHIKTWFTALETWWEGTTIGKEIDAAAKAAIAELESITASDLATAAEHTAAAMLPVLATGGSLSAIMAAGALAAEKAFLAAGADVASTTVSTFVSSLHNTISAAAPIPAPVSTTAPAPAKVS